MKTHNESGRTANEMLAVLAVIGLLSVSAVLGFRRLTEKNDINQIIQTINLGSIQILTTLAHQKMATPDQMDEELKRYATSYGRYNITFKAPRDTDREFTGTEFVAEITDKDGERIKGSMCRKLLTTMVKVNGVSDIDFTVLDEEMEDGTTQDVSMRLSGKTVDLNALCGSDVL